MKTFDEIIDFISSNKLRGINKNWKNELNFLLNDDPEIIYRISMYLRIVSSNIEIFKISKNGSGEEFSVRWTDPFCFKFLCHCCYLFPGVIQLNAVSNSISFDIKNILFWDQIRRIVFKKSGTIKLYNWNIDKIEERNLKNHQQEAVDKIIDRVKQNKRGNIVWYPVGTGKTLIVMESLYILSEMQCLPKYCIFTFPPEAFENTRIEFETFGIAWNHCDPRKNFRFEKYCVNFVFHDHLRHKDIYEFLISNSHDIFFIFDEFHKMLDTKTQRTSISLEMSKICNNFIAMTGTLVKDKDPKGIIEWVSQIVQFELTEKNYLVGLALLISRKINLHIEDVRHFREIEIKNEEYYECVPSALGGTAEKTDLRRAVEICYNEIVEKMIDKTLDVLDYEEYVFVVAKDLKMQLYIESELKKENVNSFCINSDNSLVLRPGDNKNFRVVITTMKYSTGYTLTGCKTMITSVYFSNQATRTQIEGRIMRVGQPSDYVDIYIIHGGILSYTLKNYEDARSLEKALSDLAKEI